MHEFSREELLFGSTAMERLKEAAVAVFGLGGVGSYTAEALARGDVGRLALVDGDEVALTNINRQLLATHRTVGRRKVDVMADRIAEINPAARVERRDCFLLEDTAGLFDFSTFSYVVDAVDTVAAKLLLAERCQAAGVPLISCMGTGNKIDPCAFEVADIYQTSGCPLARVMRRELRRRGIASLKVVYSKEAPRPFCGEVLDGAEKKGTAGRMAPGSCSFVPPVAGMIMAGEVIKDIAGIG